mgnify:CR=1 FL=1
MRAFITGAGGGIGGLVCAVELKEHNPDLFLEAAIPYAGRLKTKNKQFHELLRACDGIKIVCQEYAHSCFLERNRYMAGESQRVIAVYDGRERGGTLFTMRYAHSIGREVREIRV